MDNHPRRFNYFLSCFPAFRAVRSTVFTFELKSSYFGHQIKKSFQTSILTCDEDVCLGLPIRVFTSAPAPPCTSIKLSNGKKTDLFSLPRVPLLRFVSFVFIHCSSIGSFLYYLKPALSALLFNQAVFSLKCDPQLDKR